MHINILQTGLKVMYDFPSGINILHSYSMLLVQQLEEVLYNTGHICTLTHLYSDCKGCQCKVLTCLSGVMQSFPPKMPYNSAMLSHLLPRSPMTQPGAIYAFVSCPRTLRQADQPIQACLIWTQKVPFSIYVQNAQPLCHTAFCAFNLKQFVLIKGQIIWFHITLFPCATHHSTHLLLKLECE